MVTYSPEMIDKPRLVVLSKLDIFQDEQEELPSELSSEKVILISSVSGKGLDILVDELSAMLHE